MSVKQGVQRTTRLVAATTESGTVVSVPVSLPVGSLIGTAYNVISPDQLSQFKQMLCVDSNGFLSGNAVVSDVGGDLKPTHIVIQQQAVPSDTISATNPQQQEATTLNSDQHQSQQAQQTQQTQQQQQQQVKIEAGGVVGQQSILLPNCSNSSSNNRLINLPFCRPIGMTQ